MIRGTWDVKLEKTLYSFIPGDVFLLPAFTHYAGHSLCTEDTSTYFIHFFPSAGDIPDTSAVSEDENTPLVIETVTHCQENDFIPHLFKEITRLVPSSQPCRDQEASSLLDTLLYFLAQISVHDDLYSRKLIECCLEMMNALPNRFFKEVEIATANRVSVKVLRSSFMKRFGKTFYQYQMDSKLNRARYLLSGEPAVKLRTIASELGFCDEFNFSKAFKRTYGISPSEYRRSLK